MPGLVSKCPVKPFGDKHFPREHEDHRKNVCLSCFGKSGNLRPVSSEVELLLETFHPSGRKLLDSKHWLPMKICLSCQNKLQKVCKVYILFKFKHVIYTVYDSHGITVTKLTALSPCAAATKHSKFNKILVTVQP